MNKTKNILVVGSIAFDHVMSYDGLFDNVIIPGDPNFTVTASGRKINYGGCGANISYSLSLHGVKPVLLTCAGYDIGDYRTYLEALGVDLSGCAYSDDPTASAFIITDKGHNQITIFEPGAMHSNEIMVSLGKIDSSQIAFAVISPDHPRRMAKIANECLSAGIPYIFDPSQQMNVFEPEELREVARRASILILNEYESKLMKKMLDITDQELCSLAKIYIETRGEKGGVVFENGVMTEYSAVAPYDLNDPTGCGDAFRAGLAFGLQCGFDIVKCCKIGALTATYSIESPATQTHKFSAEQFAGRFEKSYGEKL